LSDNLQSESSTKELAENMTEPIVLTKGEGGYQKNRGLKKGDRRLWGAICVANVLDR